MPRLAALLLLTLTALAQNSLQVLYIANGMNRGGRGGAITAYKINADGKLTPVIGSPFDAGLIPYSLATDNGQHLYLANPALDDNNLRVFPIRSDTGRLEVDHVSTFESSNYEAERNCCPGPILADRTGRFAYVGNTSGRTISVYDIYPGSLALTQTSKANTRPGHFPVALVWGPNQSSLFTFTDSGLAQSLLHFYRRDPQKGSLTEATGSPIPIPYVIQIATANDHLLALSTFTNSSQLLVYSIKSDATVSLVGSPLTLPSNEKPFAMAVDPSNKLLAIAQQKQAGTDLALYSLDNSPTLARSTMVSCAKPCDITSLSFDASGNFLYLADTANDNIVGLLTTSLKPISGSPWPSNFQPHSLLVVNPR